MSNDDVFKRAMARMQAEMEVNGIASVRVSDGQIFMVSKKLVLGMVETMEREGQERFIIFVKQGPDASALPPGN